MRHTAMTHTPLGDDTKHSHHVLARDSNPGVCHSSTGHLVRVHHNLTITQYLHPLVVLLVVLLLGEHDCLVLSLELDGLDVLVTPPVLLDVLDRPRLLEQTHDQPSKQWLYPPPTHPVGVIVNTTHTHKRTR